jgi:vomeronasal1 receptor
MFVIKNTKAKSNFTLFGPGFSHVYCENERFEDGRSRLYLSLMIIRDLLLVVFITGMSLCMVSLLYRHHRRAQHVHSSSLSSQLSPENKAIHSILLLITCFVFFYCANNVMTLFAFYTPEKIPTMEGISGILSSFYPTICPFLLMKNNKIISQFISPLALMRFNFLRGH